MIKKYSDFDTDNEIFEELVNSFEESNYDDFENILELLIDKKKLNKALTYLEETTRESVLEPLKDRLLIFVINKLENIS